LFTTLYQLIWKNHQLRNSASDRTAKLTSATKKQKDAEEEALEALNKGDIEIRFDY
jgi:hypothetical protein